MFENQKDRKVYTEYNLPKLEIKEYNVLIDQKKSFLMSQLKVVWEHMVTFEKLQQVKEMTTQLLVFRTIIISKTIIW